MNGTGHELRDIGGMSWCRSTAVLASCGIVPRGIAIALQIYEPQSNIVLNIEASEENEHLKARPAGNRGNLSPRDVDADV
jgi:hypothetical protein